MSEQNSNSGVNTVLIVILLVVVVGGLVWFFAGSAPSDAGLQVDVNMPEAAMPTGDAE